MEVTPAVALSFDSDINAAEPVPKFSIIKLTLLLATSNELKRKDPCPVLETAKGKPPIFRFPEPALSSVMSLSFPMRVTCLPILV